jgi:IS5 family transposase
MELYNELKIRFEQPLWALNPELALMDTIIEHHPEVVKMIEIDVVKGLKSNNLGRKDTPTVEQILRASIFKETKQLDYRELELAMYENLTFKLFMKLDSRLPFSYSTLQKYISKISEENIRKVIIFINNQAINTGKETVEKVSPDTTVVETNVHYPTNNSLVWDCLKTATRLLNQYHQEQLKKDYEQENTKRQKRLEEAKKLNYNINNEKNKDKQKTLFDPYLNILGAVMTEVFCLLISENQANNRLKEMADLLPIMQKVSNNAYRFQILGLKVENSEKIFSIYEQHTDILVKGQREIEFGHKVMITRGTSNLILDYDIYTGNPNDSTLYQGTIENVINNYTVIPHSTTSDGGFASNANLEWSSGRGIVNTVFTKVTQSMKNIVESKEVETILKKWRSGTEAVISNVKRGFGLQRVMWEGFERFKAKVAWSVLCYNLRIFSNMLV